MTTEQQPFIPAGWTAEEWEAARIRSIESARDAEQRRLASIAASAAEDTARQAAFDRLSRRQQNRILFPDSAAEALTGRGDGDI